MASSEESLVGDFPPVDYATWRQEVERGLRGAKFEQKLVSATLEGIDVAPLYTEGDWDGGQDAGGFAGAAPFRRGGLPIGRHGELWDVRSRLEPADAETMAAEAAAELERGARSLWIALHPETSAPGDSAERLAQILSSVALEHTSIALDPGAPALAAAACLVAAAAARGVEPAGLRAAFHGDPLGVLARDGRLGRSYEAAASELAVLARWCTEHAPDSRAACVSLVAYHEAGANAVQEIAYALATGAAYLRSLTDGGLSLGDASRQLEFVVPIGADFFMEIAKLRALRQGWAALMAACGGDAEAQRCTIHAFSAERDKTRCDPWVNMLRETTGAFAAAAGGADAITTAGFDRLLGVSDGFARRIALNAQAILDEEAHVTQVADPAGGSYYVETLTDELCARGWTLFQAIEGAGGMLEALRSGRVGEQIAEIAGKRAALIAKRRQAITGVSEFAFVGERVVRREPRPRPAATAGSVRGETDLAEIARARDGAVMQAAVAAAKAGATLAEIDAALAPTGEGLEITALPRRRDAAAFEALRAASDEYARRTGRRPAVFLCNLGAIVDHKARAQFSAGFFSAGGIEVVDNDGFATPEDAAAAFAESGAPLAAICGTDEAYGSWVERLAPMLVERGAKRIVVAGRPGDAEARYRAAGVTDFSFMGCDVVASLSVLHDALGIERQGAGR